MRNRTLKNIVYFFLLVVTLSSLPSCNVDDSEKKKNQEIAQIADWVKTNGITATPTADGLYYVPNQAGTGISPVSTDYILYDYYFYTLLDNTPFDSSDTTFAESHGFIPLYSMGGPVLSYMGGPNMGWMEGFLNMKKGGTATFIIPSTLTPWYDYIPRRVNVMLDTVIHDLRSYEIGQISTFLDTFSTKRNIVPHYTVADTTTTVVPGVYYLETKAGTGSSPATGSTVTVSLSIRTIGGKILSTSTNTTFVIGSGTVLNGLEEGIKHMKPGGQATIILPYHCAYGNRYFTNSSGQVTLTQFSTMEFIVKSLTIN
jgi:FKBP-type peptidyl-prolyl cis-trans isomerase FkpA